MACLCLTYSLQNKLSYLHVRVATSCLPRTELQILGSCSRNEPLGKVSSELPAVLRFKERLKSAAEIALLILTYSLQNKLSYLHVRAATSCLRERMCHPRKLKLPAVSHFKEPKSAADAGPRLAFFDVHDIISICPMTICVKKNCAFF